jgi:hydrogenase maturation protease
MSAKDQPRDFKILVIGVGNPFRGDDAAGLLVARRVTEMGAGVATVIEHSGEGAALLEAWAGSNAVILIDAVKTGAAAATVHRFEPLRTPLPAEMLRHSTHAFSIPQAIELGRALDQLPARMVVFGIEGRNFQAAGELSPGVAKIVDDVARRVLEEVKALKSLAGSGE